MMKRYKIRLNNSETYTEIERTMTDEQAAFLSEIEMALDTEAQKDNLASWMEIVEID